MGLQDVGRGSESLERPLKGQQAHLDSLPEGTTCRDMTQTEDRTVSLAPSSTGLGSRTATTDRAGVGNGYQGWWKTKSSP